METLNMPGDVFEIVFKKYLKDFRYCDGDIYGYCETEGEIMELLSTLRVHGYSYSVRRSVYYNQSTSELTKGNATFYISHMKGFVPVEFFGPVFSVESVVQRECTLGPKYYKRTEKVVADHLADHVYPSKRRLVMDTKKNNCPATLNIKSVRVYPNYRVKSVKDRLKTQVIESLKQDLLSTPQPESFVRFYVVASPASRHNHGQDCVKASGCLHPLLVKEIRDVVAQGTTSVTVIRLHLERFVDANFSGENKPDRMNVMFYPTNKTIYSHIYRALFTLKKTTFDQVALRNLIDEWSKSSREETIFFRPFSDDNGKVEPLLFCYQKKWQMELLKKYGRVCLLDATYKTTKYEIPLFFLVVKSNICYLVVGLFFVQVENKSSIQEALEIFKLWNPDWHPVSWVTDFSESELRAIEGAFPLSMVYLCAFHREQAWLRWLSKRENLAVPGDKEKILNLWRHIAVSPSEQEFIENKEKLKDAGVFIRNPSALTYFEKQWLSVANRWVKAFDDRGNFSTINTTNGVESLNKQVKEFFLKHNSDKTLTGVIKVLVNDFLPSLIKKYCLGNSTVKAYSKDVPLFLHKKTNEFVRHVMDKLCKAQTELTRSSVTEMGEGLFCVQSADSTDCHYIVNFSEPSCTCQDFERWKYPCKHFCAIFIYIPEWGFDRLHENYKNCNLFHVDEQFGFGLSSSCSALTNAVPQGLEDTSKEEETNQGRDSMRSPTLLSEQQDTRELAKRVINLTYNSKNREALHRVIERLQECVQDLESSNIEADGLPLVISDI